MKKFCIIFAVAVVLFVTGCSKGTNHYLEVANPQTHVGLNPLTGYVSIFSNDGRTFSIESFKATWGEGNSLAFENFVMSERSVENRGANVEQLEIQAEINRDNWEGVKGVVTASITAAINAAKDVLTQGVSVSTDTPIGGGSIEVGGAD